MVPVKRHFYNILVTIGHRIVGSLGFCDRFWQLYSFNSLSQQPTDTDTVFMDHTMQV